MTNAAYREAMTEQHLVDIDQAALSTSELWYQIAMEVERAPTNADAASRIFDLATHAPARAQRENSSDPR